MSQVTKDANGLEMDDAETRAAEEQRAMGPVASMPVSWLEFVLGLLALTSWFVLFGGGIVVGTETHRDAIAKAANFRTIVRSGAVVFAFWTITNAGLLACVSAFLGALGRRTKFAMTIGSSSYQDLIPANVLSHYVSAVIRGFSVYGLVLAGLLVFATQTFVTPTQSEYLRIASTISVMSFYAGYDPAVLAGMLNRVKRLMEGEPPGDVSAKTEPRPPTRPPRFQAVRRNVGLGSETPPAPSSRNPDAAALERGVKDLKER